MMKRCPYAVLFLFLIPALLPVSGYGAVNFTTLVSFNGTNGAVPEATMIQGEDGFLYGTTIGGGTNDFVNGGYGTVFRISTNGEFATIHSFAPPANPQSGVLQASDGNFYGVSDYGGYGNGNFYQLTPSGAYTQLYAFTYAIGGYPHGLTLGADGAFYGTAIYGGTDTNSLGTIYKISADGSATLLASFHGTNGAHPQNRLLLATDGNFYGTTPEGGAFDLGTVFRVTPSGLISTLVSFNGTNGAAPYGALMQGRDGLIYGTTYGGGIDFSGPWYSGNGTIFTIDTNGGFTTRYQFKGYPDDVIRPGFGALVQDRQGSFYGTSEAGGAGGSGTIFRWAPDGTEKLLYSFSRPDYQSGTNADGWAPTAGLTQVGEGIFFGVTMHGGLYADGTIFRIVVTPDPPTLKGTPSSDGGNILLTWNAVPGSSYEVQSTTNLVQGTWKPVTQLVATNTTPSVSASKGPNEACFYRVRLLP